MIINDTACPDRGRLFLSAFPVRTAGVLWWILLRAKQIVQFPTGSGWCSGVPDSPPEGCRHGLQSLTRLQSLIGCKLRPFAGFQSLGWCEHRSFTRLRSLIGCKLCSFAHLQSLIGCKLCPFAGFQSLYGKKHCSFAVLQNLCGIFRVLIDMNQCKNGFLHEGLEGLQKLCGIFRALIELVRC